MSDYPRMLYRKAGEDAPELHGFHCDTMIVEDADNEEYFTKTEGWRRTPAEAHGQEPEVVVPDTPEAKELTDERDGLVQEVEDLKADNDRLGKQLGDLTNENDDLRRQIESLTKDRDDLVAQVEELTKPAETTDKKPAAKSEKA